MEIELWQHLKTCKKPIVLYGMGNGADKIIKVLEQKGIEFKGVFASEGFVRDKLFHSHKISTYAELKSKFGDMIVLLCFGSARTEVIENVRKIASEQELYAPEVPVISGELFDYSYIKKNKTVLEWVYNHLADDLSKKTFGDIINYKLSGKIDYLFDCEVEDSEPYNSFFKLCDNESFLDLGAYNGDTVEDFISRVNDYDFITALEPDSKSFLKLQKNLENLKKCETKNFGISDKTGNFGFMMRSGRNSAKGGTDNKIPFTTIDKLSKERNFTFIKMDVEGEELNAINGGKKLLKNKKPKLSVACYHKTEDLITLPKAVLKINSEYKIYMRHFVSLPAWDTYYYFV